MVTRTHAARRARLAREFGFVFQHPGLLQWRSALANVTLLLDRIRHLHRLQ